MVVGKASWFGRLICSSLDSSMVGHVGRIVANLGVHEGWMNLNNY
jgi:hypothetical protein